MKLEFTQFEVPQVPELSLPQLSLSDTEEFSPLEFELFPEKKASLTTLDSLEETKPTSDCSEATRADSFCSGLLLSAEPEVCVRKSLRKVKGKGSKARKTLTDKKANLQRRVKKFNSLLTCLSQEGALKKKSRTKRERRCSLLSDSDESGERSTHYHGENSQFTA